MQVRKMVVKAYVDQTLFVNAHYQAHAHGLTLSSWIEELLRHAVVKATGDDVLRSLAELEGQLDLDLKDVR
jgi:hypothetical protein